MVKPIAIFQHAAHESPGYVLDYLNEKNLAWSLIRVDLAETIPTDPKQFSGLIFMGGPMSVNDNLLWIEEEIALIQKAITEDIPVLGHCLGGQLLAKALGGKIAASPHKEIGWSEVHIDNADAARQWLSAPTCTVFQWHGEMFSIPEGALRMASNDYCPNQAFVYQGKHVGMQFHIEMTEDLIKSWCNLGEDEIAANPGLAVQSPAEIIENLSVRVTHLNQLAKKLYGEWVKSLA